MTERRLPGGRSFGAVRVGGEVRRPAQSWTTAVHSVLRHLEDIGFDGAPRARGFDDQHREPGHLRTWGGWGRTHDRQIMSPSLPRMASDLQRNLYRSPVIGALRHVFTTCAVSWPAELQTG
jgi:hypothetical protein